MKSMRWAAIAAPALAAAMMSGNRPQPAVVEMDGFEGNEGIIVIAATNRPTCWIPHCSGPAASTARWSYRCRMVRGREQILKVHMRKVPWATTSSQSVIARGTPDSPVRLAIW